MKRRRRTCARAPRPRVGVRTADRRELEARRAVLAAVDAPQLYLRLIEHEHVPAVALDQIREFEWDWSTVKIDWTLDGTIQWEASEARRAPVVHVTDSVDALTVQSSQLRMGLVPEQPFLIFGQYSMIDPSRQPRGRETAWAYTHVPQRGRRSMSRRDQLDPHADLPTLLSLATLCYALACRREARS